MAFSNPPNLIPLHNPNPPLETADSILTTLSIETSRRRRRRDIILSISATLFFINLQSSSSANAVDFFKFAASEPEQERSLEDAQEGIRKNARYIKEIIKEIMKNIEKKRLIDEEKKELRRSASNIKQDLYLIIQSKLPKDRSLLRSLYASLFNTITKFDYAARDGDETKVFDYYDNIVAILDDIFLQL